MGAWDSKPWDCDGASDWFGDLFDDTDLADRVSAAFDADPEDAHEEIRAAAALVSMLCRTYVWPVDKIDAVLDVAIDKLRQVAAMEIYADSPELVATVRGEIALLESRIDGREWDQDAAAAVWRSWLSD